MPINSICPSCENRFSLQEELLGKAMRCPHCKEVFQVNSVDTKVTFEPLSPEKKPEVTKPGISRSDVPKGNYQSGSINEFVPLVGASSATPSPEPTVSQWTPEIDPTTPKQPKRSGNVDQFVQVVSASTVKPLPAKPANGPTESTWSPDMMNTPEEPSAPTEPPSSYTREAVVKQPKKGRKQILIGLIAFTFMSLALGGFFLKRYLDFAPERIYLAAKKEYDETHFAQARKLFDQLVAEYPEHPRTAEAKFFAPLSGLRNTVSSVVSKSDPTQSITEWDQFMKLTNDPTIAPYADKNKFGLDIWNTGTRLLEDVLTKGNEVFNRDDPSIAEQWLNHATRIDADIERFRQDEITKPENLKRELAGLSQKLKGAVVRANQLKDIRALLAIDPDDEKLQQAREMAMSRGVSDDDGFVALLQEAEAKIRAKAIYIKLANPLQKTTVPDDGLTSLLFAPRLDIERALPIKGKPHVFFALARGILYALDEADGHVLWAVRTGIDSHTPAMTIPGSDTGQSLAILPCQLGLNAQAEGASLVTGGIMATLFPNGVAGIQARQLKTGVPVWYQPLPAPVASEPVLVGADLYVPLSDKNGTILEIVAATGEIRGKIELGRTIGGPIVVRPATGQLFIPAESASVYVFNVNNLGSNNEHKDPELIGVISTGHQAGAILGKPFFSNPEPEQSGPKHLLLCVNSGLKQMLLKACPFADSPNDGKIASNGPVKELLVSGWTRFPVYCDGEKITLVTDQRKVIQLGLGLDGNQDETVFTLPGPKDEHAKTRDDSAAQLVLADEVHYWVLAGKQLQRFRSGFTRAEGVKLQAVGAEIPVGEPIQPPQLNSKKDRMVIVTHVGSSHRATAVDTETGALLWQRELGLLVRGEPIRMGDDVVCLDQGGGISKLSAKELQEKQGQVWHVDDRWLIAAPPFNFRPITGLFPGPEQSLMCVLENQSPLGRKLLIRRITNGRLQEQIVACPAGLAGQPVVIGSSLVLPLDNGVLYRFLFKDNRVLEAGPTWRDDKIAVLGTCHVAAITEEEFLATDGNRSIVRWRWSARNQAFESRGKVTLKEKIRQAPIVLTGSPNRFVLVDALGKILLWDADLMAQSPSKIWNNTGKDPAIPINDRLIGIMPAPPELPNAMIILGNRASYALKFDQATPVWKTNHTGKILTGRPLQANAPWYVTDQLGIIRKLDLVTGDLSKALYQLEGSHAAASGAIPLEGKQLLVPLVDGTFLLAETVNPGTPLAVSKP